MANITSSGTPAGPKPSILTLDKSKDALPTQITLASDILDLNLDQKSQLEGYSDVRKSDLSDPRYEHALRWLLKKLHNVEPMSYEIRLYPRAWVLLYELILRSYPKKVAHLLQEFKFIQTLRDTLQWLQENFDQKHIFSYAKNQNGTHLSFSETSSNATDSSSTEGSTARKRKRDGTEVSPKRSAPRYSFALDQLYIEICGAVRCLQRIVATLEDHHDYDAEHMKFALRSSSDEAASILGNSMYLANQILQSSKRLSHRKRVLATALSEDDLDNITLRTGILPMIDLWKDCSAGRQGIADDPDEHAFIAHCIMPCLHLLNTFEEWARPKSEVASLKALLDQLLIKHAILPFRRAPGLPRQDELVKKGSSNGFVDALVSSLAHFHFYEPRKDPRGDSKSKVHMIVTCLSLIFKVATRSRPRGTHQLRSAKDGWLEAFFIQIRTCAFAALVPSSSTQARKSYIRLTKWMLDTCVENKLILSISSLEKILEDASGLSESGDESQFAWSIISLCLTADSSVFVTPSITRKKGKHPYRPPNKYLTVLLSKLTEDTCSTEPSNDSEYEYKIKNVLTPLMRAFADARDLMGFIGHWKERLTDIQRKRSSTSLPTHTTMWEDDDLVQAVSNICELKMTTGQVINLISDAVQRLGSSAVNKAGASNDDILSALVILDCMLGGCRSDHFVTKVAESASSAVRTITHSLPSQPDIFGKHKWRAWRIGATFNHRWSPEPDSSFTTKALELLDPAAALPKNDSSGDYSEQLQAFAFLLTLDSPVVSSQGAGKILDIKNDFCNSLRTDLFGTRKPVSEHIEWNCKSVGVDSHDKLYIGCVLHLLLSKGTLDRLSVEIFERLVDQLYSLVINRRRSSKPTTEGYVDHVRLWEALMRAPTFRGNPTLTECLHSAQALQYLNILSSENANYWDLTSLQYSMAFESIQRIPVFAFAKKYRVRIADRVLQILLKKPMFDLAKVTSYIGLLVKFTEHPIKSMKILNSPSCVSDESTDEHTPSLISLADKIHAKPWSVDHVNCLVALRRLTIGVIRYWFSDLAGESLQYLKIFYGWLSRQLDDDAVNYQGNSSRSVVIGAALELYSRHRKNVSGSLDRELQTIDMLRQRHLEDLLENCNSSQDKLLDRRCRHSLGVALEYMVPYSDLLCIHPELREIFASLKGSIGRFMNMSMSQKEGPRALTSDYLEIRLARLEYALGKYDHSLNSCFTKTPETVRDIHYTEEKRTLLRYFRENVEALGQQQKNQLLNGLTQVGQVNGFDVWRLEALGCVLVSIKDHETKDSRAALAKISDQLCWNVQKSNDFRATMLSMQCLTLLMQRHPQSISQYNIDSLFTTIKVKSSILESKIAERHSAMLYIGLCRLFSTVLTSHRTKIGGRYHLLLQALQSLLYCLFIPYAPVLKDAKPPSAFISTHASAYTRILTTLCDPTVSSVSRSKTRTMLELNDETKKARSIAGQYLQYLIEKYCAYHLKARLEPEVKAALEPGLYAVLGVMNQEVMRTTNAAMKESERAIWKALYEDWKRSRR